MQSATPSITVPPAAIEAFQKFYLAELDDRIKRSEAVGAITLKREARRSSTIPAMASSRW